MTKDEHKKLGIFYFNKTWDYMDKEERTSDDNLNMIHFAHTSRTHWELSEAPILNLIRGDWQVAKVYAMLGLSDSALLFAKSCHDKTIANNIDDFDLVFAHEIMAHAFKINNDLKGMEKHLELAYLAIDQVEKTTDKEYCKSQLKILKK